ncbi:MAG: D-serine ammonia-lyase [Acidaminococcus sp.]|jgi:D-serine dehydratase|nr:D-serine ammonia-lyase [Acidaminococcus sp.]MCI2099642.1 D-serine ammonia-lyase [Acidaminococcus sp.]MCI2113727.1 D-serine ammonia-lyase [Acidaminococcus sp.]MCI2115810.1 D-serine ammonia-lyase [Acidaminococcus sp.]
MKILGHDYAEWVRKYPLIDKMCKLEEVFWLNAGKKPAAEAIPEAELSMADIRDAEARLARFAPYFQAAFPETKATGGIIESPLRPIEKMKKELDAMYGTEIKGNLLLKCDSHLPISGSIKARGGIYEVLKFAEDVALKSGMLHLTDDYSVLLEPKFKKLFSEYSIAVGSTGNLGLSIGIISATLGFKVTVHMSADARQWKKDMLREKGVLVKEYDKDYSVAVAQGRKEAEADPKCHFVDDEKSRTLFLGYTVAALRVEKQLKKAGIPVDSNHPLFVYLPCGVGGGPGGVAFGLKQVFGDNVHCFFAEPVHSACMLLGMMTGLHDKVSVQDFGIDNKTAADGLAVGRPSSFVGRLMTPFLSGIYTLTDEHMYQMLAKLFDSEHIALEPSALAGMAGPSRIFGTASGRQYLQKEHLTEVMSQSTHIVWATGGGMVPERIMKQYYEKGKSLEAEK